MKVILIETSIADFNIKIDVTIEHFSSSWLFSHSYENRLTNKTKMRKKKTYMVTIFDQKTVQAALHVEIDILLLYHEQF